jgi:hypothetical protein
MVPENNNNKKKNKKLLQGEKKLIFYAFFLLVKSDDQTNNNNNKASGKNCEIKIKKNCDETKSRSIESEKFSLIKIAKPKKTEEKNHMKMLHNRKRKELHKIVT